MALQEPQTHGLMEVEASNRHRGSLPLHKISHFSRWL